MQLVIFGAQGYALGVYEAMKTLYPEREIPFFMVSSLEGNPTVIAEIPVREVAEVSASFSDEEKKELEVIIATPENVQQEIEETLDGYGFSNHSRLTGERWGELMDAFHAKRGEFNPLATYPANGTKSAGLNIFYARSHKDKELKTKIVRPGYMHAIQVGAANTDERIADITDDTGDNISAKNGNYCEITGLYWIWKNRLCDESEDIKDSDYFGLAQYRRSFELTEDDLRKLFCNDIDVLLPYPLMYEPDINKHHERYLKDTDWKALLTALEELWPEYAEYFPKVLGQQYMYNYNVILAKKQVLKDYCDWLFPVLARVEELSVPKGSERSDRYIGYMVETLETLYFMKNRDKLKIAHKECRMYV
ncbi:DUF4422 domain-containing protein [Butyrivibrio sp. INlla21]|uniref:DUF4422 domain-containing protein n=1 Tax=Butyrivibrio sp. INlla21 TaxID=1520811 RepID=UPI0008F137DB|nr:DUF4422 domain-containing protein [Butyrivibrio sp. INlla21]SFV03820.1 protein of unknown function [Butyrivibrio sp. INlla21]